MLFEQREDDVWTERMEETGYPGAWFGWSWCRVRVIMSILAQFGLDEADHGAEQSKEGWMGMAQVMLDTYDDFGFQTSYMILIAEEDGRNQKRSKDQKKRRSEFVSMARDCTRVCTSSLIDDARIINWYCTR